jgi:hypothetical protein
MLVEEVPPPPAPTNVDCAHAKPLPLSHTYYPTAPTAAIDETRVADNQARFYSLSVPSDLDLPGATWDLTINTGYSFEGASGADLKLHGLTNNIESSGFINWLDGENEAHFDATPPGDYCVEFKVAKGVKYSIYYRQANKNYP